jgi:hypothetical protein
MNGRRDIDLAQAGFWERIGHWPLTATDTEPYGVEFLSDACFVQAEHSFRMLNTRFGEGEHAR